MGKLGLVRSLSLFVTVQDGKIDYQTRSQWLCFTQLWLVT